MTEELNPLDNPRIKVRKSNTLKQCCIACDGFIATKDKEGNVISEKIVSVGNTPGSGKIAFSKNLHFHIKCIDLLCEQLRYAAYPHDNERIIAWEPLDD